MRVLLAATLLLAWNASAPAEEPQGEAALLSGIRQVTLAGARAGEGYFSADGRQMVFQSEREPGNPFYQMYVMDLATGATRRVSPGLGKTTCGWLHPDGRRVLFASTQGDPEAAAKQKAELGSRAAGDKRRYAWDYDAEYELVQYDLAAGTWKHLTNAPGYDAEGAYSPDGTRIVFASNRDAYVRELSPDEKARFEKDKSHFMDLYVMNADGSDVRRLTSAPGYDGGPFFSADGEKIAWRRFAEDGSKAEIFTMNADGTGERQLTRQGVISWAPFFHPSGDYLIFASNKLGHGNFELFLVDAEGRGEPVRVTDKEGFDGLPAFAPDGHRLAWTSGRTADGKPQIFQADWNDAEARRLLGIAKPWTRRPAAPLVLPPVADRDLGRHVERLSSDAFGGRLAGTAGEALATAYVAQVFESLGLEPAGDDGTWFQPFTFTAGVSLGPGNRLEVMGAPAVPAPETDKTWRPLAFAATGTTGPAPVTFAGHGIDAPADGAQAAFDSYSGLDVAGKWVLVFRDLPQDLEPARKLHLARYAELPYKAATARRKGALGLIVAPAPGIPYKDPLVRLAYDPSGGLSSLAGIAIDAATASGLLAAADAAPHDLARRLDKGEPLPGFDLPGVMLAATTDVLREARSGRNVLARLHAGGRADAPAVVLGAHVDHLGRGETSGSLARDDEKGQVHPGADDNASGVAALLAAARDLTLQARMGRLPAKRDILFAAWSGEELGVLGSSHFLGRIAKEAEPPSRIAAYLNMDMVGRLRDRLNLFGTGSSPAWRGLIERIAPPLGLDVTLKDDSYLPSDATPFYIKGIPVLHAYTGIHGEYHSPRDTADLVNHEGLAAVSRLMARLVRELALAADPPAYVLQDRPKGEGGRKRSNVYLGTIPDYAREGGKGVLVSGVTKGGPAEAAGLAAGDVIVRLAGADLETIYDYVNVLNLLKAGKPEEMVVLRAGARIALTVTPAARE
ncbi:MAG: M28 family peptidase [Magnetospirillum sp. WYHS-4]